MANPSHFLATPGAGGKIATYTVTEGADDRYIQRNAINTPEGEDVSVGSAEQIDVTITRPANTTAYTADDALSDSTTTPTVGGVTFTNCSRADGKMGMITDLIVLGSAAQPTQLQGELWLFDSAATAINDNAAFSLSITDLRKLVARIEFTLAAAGGGVSFAEVRGIQKQFKTVGSANLRGLVKVKNAYTPVSAEALTFRLGVIRTN